MTFNPSPSHKKTILPVVLITVGGILLIGWMIAMYITGIVVDEQKIDPSATPMPLMWFGGILGPAVALYGGWLLKKRKG